MALPALPPDNTDRYYFDYTSLGKKHTLIVRTNGAGTPSERTSFIDAIVTHMTSVMRESDAVTGVRFSAINSNITFPVYATPTPGQLSGAAQVWEQDPESVQVSLVGRGLSTGRKVRYIMFSPVKVSIWPANNRYEPGENTFWDDFRVNFWSTILGSSGLPTQGVTIGGDVIVPNGYTNLASNAYWQRAQRRGG